MIKIIINENQTWSQYKEVDQETFEDRLLELTTLDLEDTQVRFPKHTDDISYLFHNNVYNLYVLHHNSLPASGSFECIITDNNEQLIGFIRGNKGGNIVSFNMIFVKEDNRGQGIATDIYEQLLNNGLIIKSDSEITDATYSKYLSLSKHYKTLLFADGRVGLMK